MSWWNTGNITNLASQALKNAQKKIDKALDIGADDDNGKKQEASASVSEKEKDTGGKGQYVNAWLGDSSASQSGSSWSFPWEAGGDETADESLVVREKTAEEIKIEVLKAAKERTKAKSKLLTAKVSGTTEVVEDRSHDAERKTQAESEDIEKYKLEKDAQNVEQSTASEDNTFGDGIGQFGEKEEHRDSHSRTGNTVVELYEQPEGKDSNQDIQKEEDHTENIARLEVSVSEKYATCKSTSGSVLSSDQTESRPYTSDTSMSSSSFQELDEDDMSKQQLTELSVNVQTERQNLSRTSSYGTDLLILSKSSDDTEEKYGSESLQSAHVEPHVSEIGVTELVDRDNVNVTESPEMSGNELESICDKQDDSFTDISSSVEIILGKDIDFVNDKCDTSTAVCDISDTNISQDEYDVATEKICSDENVINVEELSSGTTDIHCENPESSDLKEQQPVIVVSGDSYGGIYVPSTVLPLDSAYSMLHSDSESSLGIHDLSMDTSCSDETLTAEGVVSDLVSSLSEKEETTKECATSPYQKDNTNQSLNTFDESADIGAKDVDVKYELHVLEQENIPVKSCKDEDSDENNYEKAELSPANSFVKCMLEDAIEDGKLDDNSDCHSGTGKSDGSRSVISSHESGDEIDTTTSSDIEIISLPTPNGENRLVSPVDHMPLRLALQKTNWPGSPSHRRSDSSGSSNNSRDGVGEMSPGRDIIGYDGQLHEGMRQAPELPALSEEDDNPYHPQRLLQDCHAVAESCDQITSHDHASSHDEETTHTGLLSDLNEKLAEMAEVLRVREDKLLQISKDNCDFMETNSILLSQLKQSEEARESEMTDLNELTAEFTQRLTDAEKRVTQAIKEKEQVKKQLHEAGEELKRQAEDMSLKLILEEKDEQIAGLLQEGEKLSKSQLQSNTIIKKLRVKEKDNETTLTSQKKKLDQQKEELAHLHKVLESKEELEKKHTEAISQLNAAVSKQEQELSHYKSESEDSQEKLRGLQAALDNSYKEMAELHRTSVVQDSKAQDVALSTEMHVREELKMTLEKRERQHKWEQESLLMQMEDVRLSMARMEKEHNRREDLLRQEIADLQKQLQEDEARTQELAQGISSATRPLLRQIDNLQSTYNAHSSTWERVERNISDRLADTQTQLAMAVEKERTTSEQVMTLNSKVTTLDAQNVRLRQEKSQLTAQSEMLQTKVDMYEDAKQNEAAQIEVLKNQMTHDMTELKKQKVLLETQLDMEKSKVEQEKKKVGLLQEQFRDMERDLQMLRSRAGTPVRGSPSPVSVSRHDSMVSSFHDQSFASITQEEFDRSIVVPSPNGSKQSLYEALRQSGAANLLENLQSQLKLREGEITHLQGEIQQLERTRESMARELVDLSNQNYDLQDQVSEVPELRRVYKEVSERNEALLQMYGEKVEQANELRLDLQDVKDMYKTQINHLLAQ